MSNDLMHVLGAALMVCGFVVWIAGAGAVKRQHLRRLGEESLLFDPSQWSTKNYDKRERSAWLRYLVLSCLVSAIGSALLRYGWS